MEQVRSAPGEVPALLAMTWLATYACVPETDHLADIAVAIVGVLLIELGTQAASLLVHVGTALVMLGAGWHGATGRASAEIGAVFAFWPLVLAGGAVLVTPSPPPLHVRFVAGSIGGVAALAVARTGALEPTAVPAWVAIVIAAPISAVLALTLSARLR
ncbi:MAG: hypothetical protein AAFY28_16210 [Actinomycetota bacterium]